MEVASQKYGDASAATRLGIQQFLNGDPAYANNPEAAAAVQEFLTAINEAYAGTLAEEDGLASRSALVELLDTCSRVVMVTHSQGNFYGNALLNDIYATYSFPNGYPIARFPMLGMMQIASPVYKPGGAAATVYPKVVGHITNSNDIVMGLVRGVMGSVAANYDAPSNPEDSTGHGLESSYLRQPGQAAVIAEQMHDISRSFIPYPLHGQQSASSSALLGFGYSAISQVLDVAFTKGGVYRYDNVSEGVASGLEGASSQGSYFNGYIRDVYDYTQLE